MLKFLIGVTIVYFIIATYGYVRTKMDERDLNKVRETYIESGEEAVKKTELFQKIQKDNQITFKSYGMIIEVV